MERNKFYSFKLKGWHTSVDGVIELIGSEWILVKRITVDYTLDGYSLIQRKYIESNQCDDETSFTEKVLLAKGIMDIPNFYNISLETQTDPFTWLKERNVVVQFNPKDDSICYVGRIGDMSKKFFQIMSMDTRGGWDTVSYKYTYAKIVAIDIDSDYVNSLITYSNFESKKDSF
ncbi:hypothetical protein [Bacteroides sp. UBA939]|uniref:hypothetical protein n=1 Tax=Bacteroides sp. UBA939 TaxID=1946092 RepID=UPI0025BDAE15|nr:hypothetical protein [Bacteroides sp. UBA939]